MAVTSCPTGIAHTFMAAEGLSRAAEKLGHWIKVETQGSVGAKNVLTAEEIAAADAVVIAADTKVDLSRFVGNPPRNTGVGKGGYSWLRSSRPAPVDFSGRPVTSCRSRARAPAGETEDHEAGHKEPERQAETDGCEVDAGVIAGLLLLVEHRGRVGVLGGKAERAVP
ncbi:MAG TPA: fructose PTS transporter subunit IIB [Cryptosporangiaceae bacterium]|nr:fructose PTS transporter subunit IIB [Cryptosporangiaceae bacterium]